MIRPIATDRGAEWDWMNFYWRVDNKDSYSFADFKSVYNWACSGSCSGDQVLWALTNSGADAVFGLGAPKATAWHTQSVNYGIDN